jgi:GT2 family glycosyltransferase
MDKITVVIPCWILNEQILELTTNCIDSLGDVFLIIIDNASPMGGGYLREKADLYVRNKENLGFAKAMNQGIKLAKTKYVALVSNDTRPSPNWQEVAREVLDKPDTFSCHFRMTNYDVPFVYGNETLYKGKERWCTAAFFVINKKYNLFFDEDYFNSFEDWDLAYRVTQRGWHTAYTNKACFQHHHSFTQKFVGFKGSDENRKIFIKKHGKDPDELLAELYPEQVKQDYYEGFNLS